MTQRHDELSTADLAGQRTSEVEDEDRVDRMERLRRMDRSGEGEFGEDEFDGRERTAADERDATRRMADDREDALADDRAEGWTGDRADHRNGDRAATSPLLASSDAEGYRARWTDVQSGFVDEPRRAVESADGLVADLMRHLAETFAEERAGLERQWDRGDDVSTDDLRAAFQRYRSFFERLLAT